MGFLQFWENQVIKAGPVNKCFCRACPLKIDHSDDIIITILLQAVRVEGAVIPTRTGAHPIQNLKIKIILTFSYLY